MRASTGAAVTALQAGNGGYVGGDYSTGKGRRVRDPDASVASGRSWGEDSLPSMRDDIGKGTDTRGISSTWKQAVPGRVLPDAASTTMVPYVTHRCCLIRRVCVQQGCTHARHERWCCSTTAMFHAPRG